MPGDTKELVLLNVRGQDASLWGPAEQGTTLLEVSAGLPPGDYELEVVPYFTDNLEPLPSSDGHNLGTVHLP